MTKSSTSIENNHQLFNTHYQDLLKVARSMRKSRVKGTMETSVLIHEAFLKIYDKEHFNDELHFLKTVAIAIRQVLIDYARNKLRLKRGSGQANIELEDDMLFSHAELEDIITMESALNTLRAMDERIVGVIDCRFFAGFTEDETAAILDITPRTVRRDWAKAKSVLRVMLADQQPS